jgi:hypothetical protein
LHALLVAMLLPEDGEHHSAPQQSERGENAQGDPSPLVEVPPKGIRSVQHRCPSSVLVGLAALVLSVNQPL